MYLNIFQLTTLKSVQKFNFYVKRKNRICQTEKKIVYLQNLTSKAHLRRFSSRFTGLNLA